MITIKATEKKSDFGMMQFSMNLEFKSNTNHSSLFYTLGKGEGKLFTPIYKSEC